MKTAFMVKLDEQSAEFVEKHAVVFESNSRVIALMVAVTRILIERGIVKWEFGWLQSLLQGKESNQRNPAAQVAGKAGALGDGSPARAPRHISATSHRNRLMADAAATGAIASAFSILPARLATERMIHP